MNSNHIGSEADARVLIDRQLDALGWETIWRETIPPEFRSRLAGGKPDYVLCYAGSLKPIAVVEAKRSGKDLAKALQQGIGYAHKLDCPVVFASDGVLTLTAHATDGKPLMINNEEVREFLREDVLQKFTESRTWIREDVIKSSQQLISIFNAASKLLRAEGMVNIDAFAEFSQILFYKIVSERESSDRSTGLTIHWDELERCHGNVLLETYKRALAYLGEKYPGVFSTHVEIKNPSTLEKIVARLKAYSFIDVKADIKGNAYEHFLRQYNRQKNELAQYFTPRHIVAMMVSLVDPKLGERVYDPFCGTGGMLIEAFRYMENNLETAHEDDRNRLQNDSVFGADISRSASAAKMNMILAGDGHSNISRTDSLKTQVDGKYDVVITNIPFVAADEKAFVRHCFSACAGRPSGRVCMIVPERILDQDDYAGLRLEILNNWTIKRIISLPREVFKGITTAKTSIIYALWNGESSNRKKQYFVPYCKVENDGYTLDKKRDPLPGRNDLDKVIEGRHAKIDGHTASAKNNYAFKVAPEKPASMTNFNLVMLQELVSIRKETIEITSEMLCREPRMSKWHEISLKEERQGFNVRVKRRKIIRPGDLVFARLHTQNGLFAYSTEIFHGTSTHLVCVVDETKVDRNFLFYALDKIVPTLSMEDTTGRENYSEEDILGLEIPLPPLEEQRKMVKKVTDAREKRVAADADMDLAKQDFWQQISAT